ncbi:bromodomain-containing protein DDB_G0270170 isoform X2 [Teleopsis dalmanni]|uniref:bromodomain-containing protein DDB_G0270170 isoform X2 n=1 Tax=Teleopsis dalmanni TaxID=139649 RepID=UPI0018CDDF26|nr:bromodomain-containing protein DDB_G0270170 isoform X2 [Teleopsis dalmanni]
MDLKKFLMLKQDVCRLVLGFMKKNGYEQTADQFIRECPELYEIFVAKQQGEDIVCSEKLEKILADHQFIKRILNKLNPRDDMSLRDKFLLIINQKHELLKEPERRDYFSAERKYNYEYKQGQKVISSQTIVNRIPTDDNQQHIVTNKDSVSEITNATNEYMDVNINQDVDSVLVLDDENLNTNGAFVEQIGQSNDQVVEVQFQGTSCGNIFPDDFLYVNDVTSSKSFMIQKHSLNLVGDYNINNLGIVQTNGAYETISPPHILNTNSSSTPRKTTPRKTTPSHVRALTFSPKVTSKKKAIIKSPLVKITEIKKLPNVIIAEMTDGKSVSSSDIVATNTVTSTAVATSTTPSVAVATSTAAPATVATSTAAAVVTSTVSLASTSTATNVIVANSDINTGTEEAYSECIIDDESSVELPLSTKVCPAVKINEDSEDMKKWKLIRSQKLGDLDTRLREINVFTGNNMPTPRENKRKPRRKRLTNKKGKNKETIKEEEETDDDVQIIQPEIKKLKIGVRSQQRNIKSKINSSSENIQPTIQPTETQSSTNVKKAEINEVVVPPNYKAEIEKRTNNIGFLLETPFKDCLPSYVPTTPGLPSLMCKPEDGGFNASSLFGSLTKSELGSPIMNAITPGLKCLASQNLKDPTPKSGLVTEYSSCGSYYKPDESEDIEIDRIASRSSANKHLKETEMRNEKPQLSKILEDGELNSTGSSNNDSTKKDDSNVEHKVNIDENDEKVVCIDENSNSSMSSNSSSSSSSSNSSTARSSSSSSSANTSKTHNENIPKGEDESVHRDSNDKNLNEVPTKSFVEPTVVENVPTILIDEPTIIEKVPTNKMQLRKSRHVGNSQTVQDNKIRGVQNELEMKKQRMKNKLKDEPSTSNKKKPPPKVVSRYNTKQAASKLRAIHKPIKLPESPTSENNSEILAALQLSAKKLNPTDTTEKNPKLHFSIKQNKTKRTDTKSKEIETNVNTTDLVARTSTRQKELERKVIDEFNFEKEEAMSSDDDFIDCKLVKSQQMQRNYIEMYSKSDKTPKEQTQDQNLQKKVVKIGFNHAEQFEQIILRPTEIIRFLNWPPQESKVSKHPKKRKILENLKHSHEDNVSKVQSSNPDVQNTHPVAAVAKLSKCEIETVLSRLHGKTSI